MASTTARNLLERSYRRLGILADEEAMTATQGSYGLTTLNDLMHGFDSEGIRYAHADLANLDAVINVPDGQIRNVMLMMCRELASEYSVPIDVTFAGEIMRAKSALQAFYFVPITAAPELAIRPRVYGRFNFSRG